MKISIHFGVTRSKVKVMNWTLFTLWIWHHNLSMFWHTTFIFLTRLYFSAEEKSYCYTRVGVRMQNVRANIKVIKFQSLCIFSCILTLLIILIKPLTTKTHDKRASGDCGTSGIHRYWLMRGKYLYILRSKFKVTTKKVTVIVTDP